jgi:hypothetical protein
MKVDIVSAYETDALIRTKDSRTDWVLCTWFKSDNGKLSAIYEIIPKMFDHTSLVRSTNWDDIQKFIDDNEDEIIRQLAKNCR